MSTARWKAVRLIVRSVLRTVSCQTTGIGRLPQITADCLCYGTGRKRWKSCGGTWWTHVTCRILPYSATVVELTNHNFPSPGWKIAIGSLSTSALAALKNLTYDQFGAPFGRQPRRHLGGGISYVIPLHLMVL